MVFLTSIDILDTGFLDKTTRTNQLASGSRVNSGTALRLKGVDFEIESSSNVDKETFTGQTSSQISCPTISVNPRAFTMSIFINQKSTDTSNKWGINDTALLTEILSLPETLGWKAMYYPVDTAATPDNRNAESQMIYKLGSSDTTENQGDIDITIWDGAASASAKDLTDVNYVSVRFEGCTMTQAGDTNNIKIKLVGVIIG